MKGVPRNKIRNKLLTLLPKISNAVKKHQSEIILAIGVILISLLSFATGFIVARNYDKQSLQIEENSYYRSRNNGAISCLETFGKGS
ncbi:MAG: hypothetical protein DRZ76_03560 [Candidatus Nealsonbacteria bacterium]|nr:MAG: hypothetical protein DRZ76_03560 [Candidatus Nealsonbacteria bacterium]